MDKQRTIEKEFTLKGLGLHTANPVSITFKPAEVDCGVVFVRTDLPDKPVIKAVVENIIPESANQRRTSIGCGSAQVNTIEHVMAALVGLGIDNIVIEVDNDEIPAFDGSSSNFVEMLHKAGIREQDKARHYCILKEPVFIEDGSSSIMALPSAEYRISYLLNYDHPILSTQLLEVDINMANFEKEIATARTFCLEEEAQALRRQGLGRGANYDNTLVVGKDGVIKNELRFENEFARHKMLDLLGDMYLLRYPLKAHIFAFKSGHSMNIKLLKKIEQQMQRYSLGGISSLDAAIEKGHELDINAIMRILPHREPFLFVDKIISLEKGKHATGIKNVTSNDYFFKGHFPGRPVMPGVLIVEAMAQVGGVMMLAPEENRGKIAYFMAADNVKFRKTVVPGDQLILNVEAGKIKSRTGTVHAKALVDGKVVAEADLMFALAEG